jgi:hypothetical protein
MQARIICKPVELQEALFQMEIYLFSSKSSIWTVRSGSILFSCNG